MEALLDQTLTARYIMLDSCFFHSGRLSGFVTDSTNKDSKVLPDKPLTCRSGGMMASRLGRNIFCVSKGSARRACRRAFRNEAALDVSRRA